MQRRNSRPSPSMPPPEKETPLSERYVYVASLDCLRDLLMHTYLTLPAIANLYAHLFRSASDAKHAILMGSGRVRKVDAVTFWPGKGLTVTEEGGTKLNLWVDPGIKRGGGSVELFLQHVAYLFDGDAAAIKFVLDWMAHHVKFPGVKRGTAILLFGAQGTGKGLWAQVLIMLTGLENAQTIGYQEFQGQFNEWLECAALVVIDEASSENSRAIAGRLKTLITGATVMINRKGVSAYRRPNRANFILLSNETAPVTLDADDRRFFVWHSKATKREPQYYRDLREWIDGDGLPGVLGFLLDRDLSSFDPHGAAPRTQARAELIGDSMTGAEAYLTAALEAGDAPFQGDLVVVNDAIDFLRFQKRLSVAPAMLRLVLKRAGARELGQKRHVGGPGKKPRVWAIRNVAHWEAADEATIAAAYVQPGEAPPDRATVIVPMRRGNLEDLG